LSFEEKMTLGAEESFCQTSKIEKKKLFEKILDQSLLRSIFFLRKIKMENYFVIGGKNLNLSS